MLDGVFTTSAPPGALALHLGHRRSRDFDFFRGNEFLPQAMPEVLGDISWDRVKAFFRAEAKRLYRDLP